MAKSYCTKMPDLKCHQIIYTHRNTDATNIIYVYMLAYVSKYVDTTLRWNKEED